MTGLFFQAIAAILVPFAPRRPGQHWHVWNVDAAGPYIDIAFDSAGNRWISSSAVQGLIRLDPTGATAVFRTPGFEPGYLTLGEDGRIWTTLRNHQNQVGAMASTGQFTAYLQPAGVGNIPASKITALGTENAISVGARAGLIGVYGGEGGEEPYPSGLLVNDDIAMTLAPGSVPWFTECCLPTGGAVGVAASTGFSEFPLSYPECSRPAGIGVVSELSAAFVPCSGPTRTILVSVNETSGKTRSFSFPGPYPARVNTVAVDAFASKIYFATGAAHALVAFDETSRTFTAIATPQAVVPTSIIGDPFSLGTYDVLAAEHRAVYEYTP